MEDVEGKDRVPEHRAHVGEGTDILRAECLDDRQIVEEEPQIERDAALPEPCGIGRRE